MKEEEKLLRSVALQNAQSILAARQRAEQELSRAREALQQQSEWLRITLASIGDAVISTDAEGRVTFLNAVAESLTGWVQADGVGRPLPEVFCIVNEHTRQPAENPALRALREGTVVGLANHTVLIARDGRERPIDDSAAPMRGHDGAAIGAVLVFRDVAERKQAEAALRESEERHRKLADNLPSGFIYQVVHAPDESRRFAYVSGGVESLCGVTPAEVVADPARLYGLIAEEDQVRVRATEDAALRERKPFDCRFRIHTPGGRAQWLHCRSAMRTLPDGGAVWEGIAIDVTEQMLAEQSLRESETRHRFLADLAAATQPLTDPADVMAVAARLLAEHLGVDRCAYAEVEHEAVFVITGDHARGGVPSIVGRWPVSAFGVECARLMLANEPYVVTAVDSDPRVGADDLPAYRATTIQAVICVPLHKGGKFTAAMAVHQKVPRHWTPAEVQLVVTVVARCWEALERAYVARTLRESEARYRAIVEATPECVKLLDPEGRLLQMNPAGLAMLEADGPEAALGRCVYDVIAPEYRDRFRDLNERVCRGERGTLGFEIIGLRGTRRYMETNAVPLPSPGGGFTQLAVTRDVTERVAAERSLKESEERYRQAAAAAATAAEANAKFRAFFEQGTNFAGVLTLDGMVVEANRLCLDACGFAREEVIGRPFWECGWWDQSTALVDMVRAACHQAAGGRMFRAETDYFVAVGARRVVDLILAPVTDDAGRVLFVAATGTDVTERREMEESLRDSDRKKDEFIALLAHELRNPLAPIRNGLQVIRLAGGDPGAVAQARDMMDRQLSHMVRLIDDLLDVSRIGQNKMELRRERVQLTDVVSSAVETARPLIDAGAHELNVSLPQRPIFLDADLTRLAQVFSNLLTNSAKFTPHGGRIWLSAERRGSEVVVSVRDTGIGIPDASLSAIFDMFSQVDRSIERTRGGLGIGLALVKGLVEMHGGTVSAASEGEDKGSTFTVTLPALTGQAEPAVPQSEGRRASSRRILVVDDSRDGADSLAMMLRLLGNEVRTANDGIVAVEQAEAFKPEVILMDVGMPRMNGLDATRSIRAQEWGRSMTIIALTGWGQEEDKERSRAAGCDAHLVKPIDPSDLERLLGEGRERGA